MWFALYRRSSSTASGRRLSTTATRRLRLSTSSASMSLLRSTVFVMSKVVLASDHMVVVKGGLNLRPGYRPREWTIEYLMKML